MKKFFQLIGQIFRVPELRRRALIVLALLAVFRLVANIPIPDIDLERLRNLFAANQFFGILNIFSGNSLANLSIAMLGVAPYITATIILQLLTLVWPKLKEMYYEAGEKGRAKFNQYARVITVPLAVFQGFGFLSFLRVQGIVVFPSVWFLIRDVIIVTAGTMFLMWLGELITEQKLSNGVSLIIFAGIVAGLPGVLRQAYYTFDVTQLDSYLIFLALALVVVIGVVYVNEAERKIPITFAKRVRGTKIYGGPRSYLPVKINQAGVIPIIFAISVLLFPATLGQILLATGNQALAPWGERLQNLFNNQVLYGALYFILVFAFTYFYTSITFEPQELSSNLQRSGAFVPGIRPGAQTAQFLRGVVGRTTLAGAVFLGVIAVLPILMQAFTGFQFLAIGGTSILIVVSVALESLKQIESEMSLRRYEV